MRFTSIFLLGLVVLGVELAGCSSGGGAAGNAGGSGAGGGFGGAIGGSGGGGGKTGGSGGAGGVIGGAGGATGATGGTGAAPSGGGTGGGCSDGQEKPCYTGPPATDGVGECKVGKQTCSQGVWGPCEGQVLPLDTEFCNGLDDDCDGLADEDLGQTSCGTGACSVTVDNCVAGGLQTCTPKKPNPTEACDGIDDDCDGQIDEGCACVDGKTQSCYGGPAGTAGNGICKSGTQTCASGKWGACAGQVLPKTELCNGLDDDCDGTPDDGQPEAGQTCDTGKIGECKIGTTSCTNGTLLCNQLNAPSPEVCDGKDNNCNGSADDGNPEGGKSCNTGKQGVCAGGTTACTLGTVTCQQNAQPSPEKCDGADNDCDGQTDEGNPGGGVPCDTGKLGVCAAGTTACSSGALGCVQNVQPVTETCDGSDDDCDGQTDEGCQCINGQSQSCYTGDPSTKNVGLCKPGTQTCSGGLWGPCNGEVLPASESCNGKDDDCDNATDEGNPGGGAACTTGLPGICSAGTMTCTAGALGCKQNQTAAPTETCGNSLDDNCNGQTDEGCSIVTAQVLHYELEQASGTSVPNLAPGGPAGTINGLYTWSTPGGAPAPSSYALTIQSPGTNNVYPNLNAALTNLTIEFWWRWDSGTALAYMWYQSTGSFRAFTNGVAYSGIYVRSTPGGADVVYTPSVQDNAWHHIAYVMDAASSKATLYVDGASVGTSAYSGSITLGSTLYVLGRNGDNGAQVRYDRYRIWNQALTAAQIAAIKAGTM